MIYILAGSSSPRVVGGVRLQKRAAEACSPALPREIFIAAFELIASRREVNNARAAGRQLRICGEQN
jgi:hypothetical protein